MCAKCGYELFSSRSKYAHSSPWPAFTETIHTDSVAKRPEHNRPGAIKVGGSCGAAGKGCWPGGPENRPPLPAAPPQLQGPTICLFQASGLSLGSCHPKLLGDAGALVRTGKLDCFLGRLWDGADSSYLGKWA